MKSKIYAVVLWAVALALWSFVVLSVMIELSLPARADTAIYIGDKGIHLQEGSFNNDNRIFAGQIKHIVFGYFFNSYRKDTFFAAYDFDLYRRGAFHAGVLGGIDFGYSDCLQGYGGSGPYKKKVCPAIVPYVGVRFYHNDRVSVGANALLMGDYLGAVAYVRF